MILLYRPEMKDFLGCCDKNFHQTDWFRQSLSKGDKPTAKDSKAESTSYLRSPNPAVKVGGGVSLVVFSSPIKELA